jgi:PAS domain S-box-containing protein
MPVPPVESSSAAAGGAGDQLRLLIEAQTDYALFLLDTGGHIITWNPGAARIKGYTADEIIGEHFSRFYTQPDIDRDHPAHELEIALSEGKYAEEGWRVRKDGTTFWASVVITALHDDDGRHVGFGKVTRDLTERRRAELALEQSEAEARAEADRQRRRTAALEQVGRAVVARIDLDGIVQTATDAATELTGAQFGAFFYNVIDEAGESYMLYAISGVAREEFSRFPMPRNTEVFDTTFSGHGVMRSDDITTDPRYGKQDPYFGMPDGHLPVRSYLAVPVVTTDGEVAGGLFFGHGETGVFTPEDEEAVVSVAASAAVALVNARLLDDARREAEARRRALEERDHVARVLQQSLLPPALPTIPGLELGSHYQAGTELVGGDYYDVFSLGDSRWGIVLGDVCGSGAEAASRTALTRHSVRTAAMFDNDPSHVLGALNTALMRSGSDRFTTAVFARIEPRPEGGMSACLASGGHPPAVVCHPDGTTDELFVAGPLLGIVDDVTLHTREADLDVGDVLVLYTDGLVEARRSGELYGTDRLREAIARHRDDDADALAEALVAEASAFAGGPVSDDIAVVVVRVVA